MCVFAGPSLQRCRVALSTLCLHPSHLSDGATIKSRHLQDKTEQFGLYFSFTKTRNVRLLKKVIQKKKRLSSVVLVFLLLAGISAFWNRFGFWSGQFWGIVMWKR